MAKKKKLAMLNNANDGQRRNPTAATTNTITLHTQACNRQPRQCPDGPRQRNPYAAGADNQLKADTKRDLVEMNNLVGEGWQWRILPWCMGATHLGV